MSAQETGIALWAEHGGAGAPVLVLCHGMSGTGAVWDGIKPHLAAHWPGRWIIPDLRGHGRSDHATGYGIAQHAADLAALIQGTLARESGPVVMCGHSMGGLAALVVATGWYGVDVSDAIAVGVKARWTEEEIARSNKLIEAPVRWFESREAAIERFLLVSGLTGLIDPTSPAAATGVVAEDGRWRLAADNRTALVRGADMTEILAVARRHANVVLATGSNDAMVPVDALLEVAPDGVVLDGLGHNAHLEDPARIWSLIDQAIETDD